MNDESKNEYARIKAEDCLTNWRTCHILDLHAAVSLLGRGELILLNRYLEETK